MESKRLCTCEEVLWNESKGIKDLHEKMYGLANQMLFYLKDFETYGHKLAGFDADLEKTDLNDKEELSHSIERDDNDQTLP